jgi:hypothetical protein
MNPESSREESDGLYDEDMDLNITPELQNFIE